MRWALLLCLFVSLSLASHFRYGHLTFRANGGRSVIITAVQAWRRDYSDFRSQCGSWFWSADCNIGATVTTGVLSIPGGSPSQADVKINIATIDYARNYFTGSWSIGASFGSDGPFQLSFYTCCRIDGIVNVPAELPTTASLKFAPGRLQSSPVSSVAPIMQMQQNRVNKFLLPASDADGDLIRFSRYTIGNGAGASNNLAIDPVSGMVTWNPGGSQLGLYTMVFKMEDYDNRNCAPPVTACSGAYKLSDVMVDFFIEVVANDGNTPPSFVSPTPDDGSSIPGSQGQTVTFPITAVDANGDSITLQAAWSTPGMAFSGPTSGGSTLNSGFSWTVPSGAAANAVNQACFIAKDPKYESPQRCITIKVGSITVTSVATTSGGTWGWADGGDVLVLRGQNMGAGTNYKCRFLPPQTNLAAIDQPATFVSVNEIRCTTPNVRTNPGVYRVEASKDGVGFTDDRKTFTLNPSCPPSITNMCSGHGTCLSTGVCQCTAPWQGASCSGYCGNGVIENGEQCDDGNTNNGDGCSSGCGLEGGWSCNGQPSVCQICGNGKIEGSESCDDNNVNSGDGCSNVCAREGGWTCNGQPSVCQRCGDGVRQGTEACDDGNVSNGDGCNGSCAVESGYSCSSANPSVCQKCGNSKREGTEGCDDGNLSGGDGCDASCNTEGGWSCSTAIPNVCQKCGNSRREGTEGCDDGNVSNGDGCSSTCAVESGYVCSAGIPNVCQKCGNSLQEGTEGCDDGNVNNNDGCSATCSVESGYSCSSASPNVCQMCGNSRKEGTEGCDDGNLLSGDGCSGGCTVESGYSCSSASPNVCQKCGNGKREGTEECDDGNVNSNDGCSASCTIESGFSCSTAIPNVCQKCGNSKREGTEGCDDGNVVAGDGCDAVCAVESGFTCSTATPNVCQKCGNGKREGTEECDDGNQVNINDGCFNNCKIEGGWKCTNNFPSPDTCVVGVELCGNGKIDGTEACDDGNKSSGDGCSSACVVEPPWTCVGGTTTTPSKCYRCGNSVIENYASPVETCDDGNAVAGDGCSAQCVIEGGWSCGATVPSVCQKCGNGKIEGTETCDDSNTNNNDGCSSSCATESGWTCNKAPSVCQKCGNGVVEGTEGCDDSNTATSDGCSDTCAIESGWFCNSANPSVCEKCGNGKKEGSEACDDNNVNSGDGCSSSCTIESGYSCRDASATLVPPRWVCKKCQNSLREDDEGCDDGNSINGDGCAANCTIEVGFICNVRTSPLPDLCQSCANSKREGTEGCDDGNTTPGDGCDATCNVESGFSCSTAVPNVCQKCGNSKVEGTESCDDGNVAAGDGCDATCAVEPGFTCSTAVPNVCQNCGNGKVEGSEGCDDGNVESGDGCSGSCAIEPKWECPVKLANGTSVCNLIFVPPLTPGTVLDLDASGTFSGDVRALPLTSTLKASWSGFFWPNQYWYKIGTYPDGDDVLNYTLSGNNGKDDSATVSGLSLTHDMTYYFTVKSANNETTPRYSYGTSKGVRIDKTAPLGGSIVDGATDDTLWTKVSSTQEFYWQKYLDPESGLKEVWWSMGTYEHGDDVVAKTKITDFNITSIKLTDLALVHGQHYYYSVNATNTLGVTTTKVSNGFGVDLIAPRADNVVVRNGLDPEKNMVFWGQPNMVGATWTQFTDSGSGVQHIEWAIGTTQFGEDVQVFTDIGLATSIKREELSNLRENGTTLLEHGKTYYVSLKAYDFVGQSSKKAGDPFTVDLTAPKAGEVVVGFEMGQATSVLLDASSMPVAWSGFGDPESSINYYEVALGTTVIFNSTSNTTWINITDVLPWTRVSSDHNELIKNLALVNNTEYYVSVRALNGAGVYSEPVTAGPVLVAVGSEPGPGSNAKSGKSIGLNSAAGKGLIGAGVAAAALLIGGVATFMVVKAMRKSALKNKVAKAREARANEAKRVSSLAANADDFKLDLGDNNVEMQTRDPHDEVETASHI